MENDESQIDPAVLGVFIEALLSRHRVALPVHAHQMYGNGVQLPVLMEPGTFAVDPEPWGPPWRTWEQVDPEEASARGVHAPAPALTAAAHPAPSSSHRVTPAAPS